MRAFVALGGGVLESRDIDEPQPESGQAVVAVTACTLCGSDLHDLQADQAAPRVLGHELAGVITAVGAGVGLDPGTSVAVLPTSACGECPSCRAGRPNLCRESFAMTLGYGLPGGLAERVLVPRAEAGRTLFPLPEGTDPVVGALAEPAAVALRAARRAGAGPGVSVLVMGAGPIGLLVALCVRLLGAGPVVVVEPRERRQEAAVGLGFVAAADARDPSVTEAFASAPFGRPDVVVDAAGAPAALAAAVRAVRPGGRLLTLAGYGSPPGLDMNYLIRKEVDIVTSFAYTPDDYAEALRYLLDGTLPVDALITHRFPQSETAAAFEVAAGDDAVKVAVTGDRP
jgi:2-desacetyl-2-hydroxyethyl bacteriochlorophyllide A dehydrogenase